MAQRTYTQDFVSRLSTLLVCGLFIGFGDNKKSIEYQQTYPLKR